MIFKNIRLGFFLFLTLASSVTGLLLFTPTTHAAASDPAALYIAPGALADATASAFRVSLALCLTSGGGNGLANLGTITAQNVATGNWFLNYYQVRPGIVVWPKADDYIDCGNFVGSYPAATSLGFADNVSLACGIGLVRVDGKDCLNDPQQSDFKSNFGGDKNKAYAAIDSHRTNAAGGPAGGYNNVQLYVIAAQTFTDFCQATPKFNVGSPQATPAIQALYANNKVTIVDSSGLATPVYYDIPDGGKKAMLRNYEGNFAWQEVSCSKAKDLMNQYSVDYAKYVGNNKPGSNGNPGTCDERYSPTTDKVNNAACQAGFNNKGTPNYCPATYPTTTPFTQAELSACIYGYGTATAATGVTAQPPSAGGSTSANKSTCVVEGIGWILCPVLNFMSKIVDAAYGFVASLLVIQPLLVNGASTGVFGAWSVMRNFANVAFVIGFLIIIFSQLTSVGISNYGIKKMLPRLIVAAILVNLSYWLCAIAVDLSNIVGGSINEVLKGIGNNDLVAGPNAKDFGATGSNWTGIVGFLLAGGLAVGAALYIGLSALLPALIAALLAIVTVFIVLTIRQALIILLIVISPLAMVAYLLPNTESLFKKWRQLFQTLLLMYPIIAGIFGASALASTVVMNSATGTYKIAIQIMGALIAIIPLAITPLVMKTAGSLLGKFGGAINNPNKGPFDRMNKGAEGFRKRQEGRREIRALSGKKTTSYGKFTRGARRNDVNNGVEAEVKRSRIEYGSKRAEEDPAFRNRIAGGRTFGADASPQALNRALAGAISIQAKVEADEVTAQSAVIKHMNMDRNMDVMRAVSQGGKSGGLDGSDRATRAAAMRNVIEAHDVEGVNKLLDQVNNNEMDQKQRESFADSLGSSSQKPQYVGQSALSAIRQHGELDKDGNKIVSQDSTNLAISAVNNNTYSVDKIASGDQSELEYVRKTAEAGLAATDPGRVQFKANAQEALDNKRFAGQISKNKQAVTDISNL